MRLIRTAFFSLAASFLSAAPALAQIKTGLEETAKTAFGGKAPAQKDLTVIIGALIRGLLSFVGVLFTILLIYGGVLWMTARGNEQQIEKAKSILTSAVIGLVIIAAGYAITEFVLTTVLGAATGGAAATPAGSACPEDWTPDTDPKTPGKCNPPGI